MLRDGEVEAVYRKIRLPNYGVFDEVRYFEPGLRAGADRGRRASRVGLTICEDIWEPGPPASVEAEAGAQLIVNASGSPYLRGKGADRERMFAERARAYGVPIAFCNLVGGQDELVFDGRSFVVDAAGRGRRPRPPVRGGPAALGARRRRRARLEQPLERPRRGLRGPRARACATTRARTASSGSLVGLSGGIDSALVALIAADALGAEQLTCVVMPSPHSSDATQADARAIAANLGAELIELPIDDARCAPTTRCSARTGAATGLAAENIQARIRGNLLMALSNDRGALVLTTGNKSEMSVGYATLYGDMAGGFAVIKDVPKQLVYELVAHRNARGGPSWCPRSVIDRAPSAELRADQRDEDSLPPYELLDRVLEGYVERDRSRDGAGRRGPAGGRASTRSSGWSTAPSTSAARRRRGSGSRARPSAATGGCRSRTASAASRPGRPGRTAIVIRTRAQRRPSSSVISQSQTQVVRPRWRGRASALTCRRLIGRRKRRLVRLPHRHHAVVADRLVGRQRAERLGERRVGAAVDDPERLADGRA